MFAQSDSLLIEQFLSSLEPEARPNALLELGTESVNSNPSEAFRIAAMALESAKAFDKADVYGEAYMIMGLAAYYQSDVPTALQMFSKAISAFETNNNANGKADAYYNIALLSKSIGDYDASLENFQKALSIFSEIGQVEGIADCNNEVGTLFRQAGKFEESLGYLNEALDMYKSMEDSSGIATVLNNLGNVMWELRRYDSAEVYYKSALLIKRERESEENIASTLNNLGSVAFDQKKFAEAMDYYKEALLLYNNANDLWGIANTYLNLGAVEMMRKHYAAAEEYVLRGERFADNIEAIDLQRNAYYTLSEIYSETGRFKEAYNHYKMYTTLHDSMLSKDITEQINDLNIKYQTAQKESENELLRKSNALKNEQLKKQQLIFISLTFLVLFIIFFLYYRYYSKKKVAETLSKKNSEIEEALGKLAESEEKYKQLNASKDKFFSIIAHDLRNPFTTLIHLTEILIDSKEELSEEEEHEYLIHIKDASRNTFNLLENLLKWSRSQTGVIEYTPQPLDLSNLAQETVSLLSGQAIKKGITLENGIPNETYVEADPEMILTVLRNLTTNAVKFTPQDGSVTLKARKLNGTVEVEVSDTGIGISEEDKEKLFRIDVKNKAIGSLQSEKGTGLGLILCKEFILKHGGDITVESSPNKGSTFRFTLPSFDISNLEI